MPSISAPANRAFASSPHCVIAKIAATNATSVVIIVRARAPLTAINTPHSASTHNADGRRAAHSSRWFSVLKDIAMAQFTSGGLRRKGFPPTCGTSQSPSSSIVTAARMRRPSSPLISVEPSPGR